MRDGRWYFIGASLLVLAFSGADPGPVGQPAPQPSPTVATSPTAAPTPLLKRIVSTYAGTGKEALADGPLLSASFKLVRYIAVDPDRGSQFVTDGNQIRELTNDGRLVTVAGAAASGSADGAGMSARLSSPLGLAYDPVEKSIYFCDNNNQEIRRMTQDGAVTTIAGAPKEGRLDGTGANARFSNPWGIAYDKRDGELYITESTNNDIRRVSPAGVVTTLAGSRQGYANGLGTGALFNHPTGIAYDDADGNLYVLDSGNHRIRRVTPAGGVTTYAGSGKFDIARVGGPAANSTWGAAGDIAWDNVDNSLYVTDADLNSVRRISPDGYVSNIAGNGASGSYDGVFEGAAFSFPIGIAVDPKTGYLYVADFSNNLIRLIR